MTTYQGAPNAPSIDTEPPTDGEQAADTSPNQLQLPSDVLRDILRRVEVGYTQYEDSGCLPPEGLQAVYSSCRMAHAALLPWIGRRIIDVPRESCDGDWSSYNDHFEGPKDHLVQRLLCREFPRGATLRSLQLQLSDGMAKHLDILLDSPAAADVLASITDLCLVFGSLEVGHSY